MGPVPRRPVYFGRNVVVEFEMDYAGMRRVAVGAELKTACYLIARKAQPYAEAIAPRDSGDFARSFDVNMGHAWVAGMRRVAARLLNTDPGAAAIEFGYKPPGRPPVAGHHTLRRTLAHIDRRAGGLDVAPLIAGEDF